MLEKTEVPEKVGSPSSKTLEWHSRRWVPRPAPLLLPGSPCPAFSLPALMEDGQTEKVFSRESFQADYVVVLFLPMDGSVDFSELAAFGAEVEQLRSLGCQVVGVARDSILSPLPSPLSSLPSATRASSWSGPSGRGGPVGWWPAASSSSGRRGGCATAPSTHGARPSPPLPSPPPPPARCVARSPDEVARQVATAKELAGPEQAAPLLPARPGNMKIVTKTSLNLQETMLTQVRVTIKKIDLQLWRKGLILI